MTKAAALKRLEKAAEREAAAAAAVERAREAWEASIIAAAADGYSVREIAAVAGVSKSRIQQITAKAAS
jgi:transposase